MRKHAKKKLQKVDRLVFRKQTVLPDTAAYVNLYAALQALYCQKKYDIVISVCNALLESIED